MRNFLIANALYWLEEFHVDGLRVDAVASMLYLDYSREEGAVDSQPAGGRENLDAVEFLATLNAAIAEEHPACFAIAEESTAWPGVTRAGRRRAGSASHFKWNMGWMHDTLDYFAPDPVTDRCHHESAHVRA